LLTQPAVCLQKPYQLSSIINPLVQDLYCHKWNLYKGYCHNRCLCSCWADAHIKCDYTFNRGNTSRKQSGHPAQKHSHGLPLGLVVEAL